MLLIGSKIRKFPVMWFWTAADEQGADAVRFVDTVGVILMWFGSDNSGRCRRRWSMFRWVLDVSDPLTANCNNHSNILLLLFYKKWYIFKLLYSDVDLYIYIYIYIYIYKMCFYHGRVWPWFFLPADEDLVSSFFWFPGRRADVARFVDVGLWRSWRWRNSKLADVHARWVRVKLKLEVLIRVGDLHQ